jgi:XTP/dITP diphosphohydrolase
MPYPIPPAQSNAPNAFERLLTVLHTLREACPWDRKQTMQTLRHLSIEEMYELTDAILEEDMSEIKKEIGDLMMHLVFYARIAEEQKAFDIVDVLNSVCDKLIHRHPHIYADVEVKNEDEVKQNWEKLKLKEGQTSVLAGVPKSLPALVKAYRIQDKVRGVGFDWEEPQQVWEKVQEELSEFNHEIQQHALEGTSMDKAEAEFGDLLFSMINYARFVGINPETALERTNKKFMKRFQFLEQRTGADGKKLQQMTLEEMDVYWEQAKQAERSNRDASSS